MKPNRSYDSIMQQSLAQLRQKAAQSFRRGELAESFESLCDDIGAWLETHAPARVAAFQIEKAKALAALAGQPPEEMDILTPERQLLWGAALGASMLTQETQDVAPTENELWKAVTAQDLLEEERRFCVQSVASIPGLRERQGTLQVEWSAPRNGYPDMGFFCDPPSGTIHIDPVWTLIAGIEPARSFLQREAALGLGTLFFTPEMQRVRGEMAAIKEQAVRTPDEHIHMLHLAAQWLARYDITVAGENNFGNRFAADRGDVSAQDYGSSINYAEAVAGGIPDAAAEIHAGPPSGRAKFLNLQRAINYSFFAGNGFFEDDAAGWRSVGVEPDWIETADGAKRGMAALAELRGLCAEMESLQPGLNERMTGDTYYARRMAECSIARCAIADRIFARFAHQYLPELEREAEQNPFETMDRIDRMLGDGGKEKKPTEPGEGGEPDETADVEGKGKQTDVRLPPKDPREAKGRSDEDGPGQDGEGSEPGEGEGQELGDGEGEGPGDGDGDGDGNEPGDGEGDGDGDGEPTDSEEKDELKKLLESLEGEGGRNHGGSFTDEKPELHEEDGSYNEYLRIIAPHRDLISETTAVMRKIQEKLTIRIQDPGRHNSLVPEDGDVGRFQSDALQSRLVKQFSGQAIDESDFETFRVDGPIRTISPPTEIHIWIDGSGSMSGAPVDMAITTGCILYEAAREAGMDVYITMLGDPEPLPIALPGQSDKEIGRAIESVRQGQGGDKDYLAPTIDKMVRDTLKRKKNLGEPVGNTHAFVVSDGMFTDEGNALELVKSVNQHCPHATLDFVLINARGGLAIEKLADDLNAKSARAKIGYREVASHQQIHEGLMELLNARLKDVRQGDAISLAQKQKEFKTVKLKDQYRRGR